MVFLIHTVPFVVGLESKDSLRQPEIQPTYTLQIGLLISWTYLRFLLSCIMFHVSRCRETLYRRFREISKNDYYLRYIRPFVRSRGATWLPLNGSSWNLIFWIFFENMPRKFKFNYFLTRTKSTLHYIMLNEEVCRVKVYRWIILTLGNVWDKFIEKIKTQIFFQ